MDRESEYPRQGGSRRRLNALLAAFVFVLGAGIFSLYLFRARIESPGVLLHDYAALVSQTIKDSFGFKNENKLAAEADLAALAGTPGKGVSTSTREKTAP